MGRKGSADKRRTLSTEDMEVIATAESSKALDEEVITTSEEEEHSEDDEEEQEMKTEEPLTLEGSPPGFNGVRRVSLPFCVHERKETLKATRIPIHEQEVQRVEEGVVGRILLNQWVILWRLGKGNGGSVYLGNHIKTNENVAIKIISKAVEKSEAVTHKRIKRALKEACIMRRLQGHKHIIQLHEVFEDDEHIFLIMQYAEGGDLFEHIKRMGKLSASEAMRIFLQVVRAMATVHSNGIVHRDIKPENVFLDRRGKVLIGDWGLACRWSSYKKNSASCGSVNYAASEIVCRRPYVGPEVDIFSMGSLLYTMLTARLPFGPVGSQETLRRVARGQFYIDPCLTPAAVSLFKRLFEPDPLKRASIYDILSWATQLKDQIGNTYDQKEAEASSDDEEEKDEDEKDGEKEQADKEPTPVPQLPPVGLSMRRRMPIYA